MRVISGIVRGRKLNTPVRENLRPTTDRVKESIFNILQFDIEGRHILDLFAGTGQLGIEALSRGAADAVFVESGNHAVRIIRENLRICGFSENARVYNVDALRYLEQKGQFDIILLDPPYDQELVNSILYKIQQFDKLRENGIIICEMRASTPISEITFPYKKIKEYKYGSTVLVKIVRMAL